MPTDLRVSVLEYIKNKADTQFLELVNSLVEEYEEEDRISLEEYNTEIDESINQIGKGEVYTHQEVGERILKWSKK